MLSGKGANDPDRLRRFEQEARAASALDHPNIITVHEIGNRPSASCPFHKFDPRASSVSPPRTEFMSTLMSISVNDLSGTKSEKSRSRTLVPLDWVVYGKAREAARALVDQTDLPLEIEKIVTRTTASW